MHGYFFLLTLWNTKEGKNCFQPPVWLIYNWICLDFYSYVNIFDCCMAGKGICKVFLLFTLRKYQTATWDEQMFFTHVSTSCETFGKQKGWILKENMITVLQLMQDFVGWICKSLSCVFRPLQQWGKILCITCKVIVWVMLNFGCQSNRFFYFCNRNNIEYYM